MNKEEIEKKKKMLRDFSEKGQGQRVFFEEDLELIRDILKELEQKESKLNKVTEECRRQMKEYEDSILEIFPQRILEIIEGEKE